MGKIHDFEDLVVWQMAREIANTAYSDFGKCHDYVFREKIADAALSVMNNITEGFSLNSDSLFSVHLGSAKAQAAEIKSMYYIAQDQGFITEHLAMERRDTVQRLINSLASFSTYLNKEEHR
jgi:four helix bundle protein